MADESNIIQGAGALGQAGSSDALDERVMIDGRLRQRTRSGEARKKAENNFKPLSLDRQLEYIRKFEEEFKEKSPVEIEEAINRKNDWSVCDLKGLKCYLTSRLFSAQMEAEDGIQEANHASLRKEAFRKLVNAMNEKLVTRTQNHISIFMSSDDFSERCRQIGERLLQNV